MNDDDKMRAARIIFERLAHHLNGYEPGDREWAAAIEIWRRDPSAMPMLDTCVAAADAVLSMDRQDRRAA